MIIEPIEFQHDIRRIRGRHEFDTGRQTAAGKSEAGQRLAGETNADFFIAPRSVTDWAKLFVNSSN